MEVFFFHFLGLNGINLLKVFVAMMVGGSFRENCFRIAMESKTQTSYDHVSLKIPPVGFGDVNLAWCQFYFAFILNLYEFSKK